MNTRLRKNITTNKNHQSNHHLEPNHVAVPSESLFEAFPKKLCILLALVFAYLLKSSLTSPPIFSDEVQAWFDDSHLFRFHDYKIYYHDERRGTSNEKSEANQDTEVLLVIHGFPASSYTWKTLVPKFHTKFARVIMPDLIGLGFSDKPIHEPILIMNQTTMIEGLLKHLGISQVHVVAHDYGVSIAQELLARSSNSSRGMKLKIQSVCFTNGGLVPSHHNLLLIQKVFSTPLVQSLMPRLLVWPVYKSRLSSIFGPESQPSEKLLIDIWAMLLYKDGHFAIPNVLDYIFQRRANEKRWVGALQTTSVPLHLIYGPLDPVNTPEGFLKTYRKLVPHSTVSVLENIGHYPQIEDEDGFIRAYNLFLENKVNL